MRKSTTGLVNKHQPVCPIAPTEFHIQPVSASRRFCVAFLVCSDIMKAFQCCSRLTLDLSLASICVATLASVSQCEVRTRKDPVLNTTEPYLGLFSLAANEPVELNNLSLNCCHTRLTAGNVTVTDHSRYKSELNSQNDVLLTKLDFIFLVPAQARKYICSQASPSLTVPSFMLELFRRRLFTRQ